VDLWHPDLTDDEVALLDELHRYAAGLNQPFKRKPRNRLDRAYSRLLHRCQDASVDSG